MDCPSCGQVNQERAAFCRACGAALAAGCPACRAVRRREARFCHACGHTFADPAAQTQRLPADVAPSLTFGGGRYQVRRFLGEGGNKRVFLVHDARLARDVALALIKPEALSQSGVARLQREAQAMGRLGDHPNIVTVYDIGDEEGQPYIVSQYVAGGAVDDLLRRRSGRPLDLEQALGIAEQVCRALEHAHAHGMVHRDLKPGNVWLAQDGTAMLGDFGLAVSLDQSRLTRSGAIVGTVAYMPPEQALGGQPTARSDLYALGVMLYEMVTGRTPFRGDDPVSIIFQHIHTQPVAPSWHNPAVPCPLDALILRLLAKAPDDRAESAAEVRRRLVAVRGALSSTGELVQPDELNPLDRLAGGVFVGREREVAALRVGLEDALSGRARVLLLAGEPGIGKTRTADEIATEARMRGAQVLWGRCYEGEGAPAFWPWVQIVRSYTQGGDRRTTITEMGANATIIGQIVTEVREQAPDLPLPPPLGPEEERFRLFDGITEFLKNAATRRPLVLVLDDLHWADKPSLLLLEFLARELRTARTRLLVVGAYRDVEVGRQHPLAATLAALAQEEHVARVPLRGLAEPDVARFIEMTAGVSPDESLTAAVWRETEGNPFFMSEVVRLLAADRRLEGMGEQSGRVTIPQSVREVIGRRLDRLSEACNQTLTLASVIGREFRLEMLERVSDLDADLLLEALEEATAARVITEDTGRAGRYRFAHALIRETLYEELSTARRVRLHRQVGLALERLWAHDPRPHLAELAHHFFQAVPGGDVQRAVDYAVRAAQRAGGLLAYEEAAGLYERALQALEALERVDESRRCELLLALGDVQWKAGETDAARGTFLRAAGAARAAGSAELLARAALAVGAGEEATGVVDSELLALLDEATMALGEDDSALRARLIGRMAWALYYSGSQERRQALGRQAVAMARRVGDPATLAHVLSSSHWALWEPENVEDRRTIAGEIVALADQTGDRQLSLLGYVWRIVDLLELGDLPAVDEAIATHARLAEELRQPYARWFSGTFRAMRALLDGRFAEGERLATEALTLGQRVHQASALQNYGAQIFTLRREQGRLAEMEPVVRQIVARFPSVIGWRSSYAYLLSELGRLDQARDEFERLAADDFANVPRDNSWVIAVTLLSDVSAVLDDARRAAALYAMLLPHAGRTVVVGRGVLCNGSASRYLGVLATTMRRWDEAERHLAAALAMNERIGAAPWLARTRQDYATMLLARDAPGDRSRAEAMLDAAVAAGKEIGMVRLVDEVTAVLARG